MTFDEKFREAMLEAYKWFLDDNTATSNHWREVKSCEKTIKFGKETISGRFFPIAKKILEGTKDELTWHKAYDCGIVHHTEQYKIVYLVDTKDGYKYLLEKYTKLNDDMYGYVYTPLGQARDAIVEEVIHPWPGKWELIAEAKPEAWKLSNINFEESVKKGEILLWAANEKAKGKDNK